MTQEDLKEWPHLQDLEITTLNSEIGLMIGNNVPQAVEPWEFIHSPKEGGPFAVKSKLGWIVHGQPKNQGSTPVRVNRIKVQEVNLDQMLTHMYNHEFLDVYSTDKGLSEEDKQWNAKVENSCRTTASGH